MSLSIDVVIPTYQGWELTESCLEHLRRQEVSHRVIVADNASSDGTPEFVRAAFPEVTVVETGGNLGFPVACNRGAEAGSGEVVVLLNNDVECPPEFLTRLVEPLERDARLGSVAAVLLRPGGERIDSVGLVADPTYAGFPRLTGRPAAEATSQVTVLTGPAGAAAAYRREAWEALGGLDEGVFIYGEDLELALRLRGAGWETALAPEAVAVHLGSATMRHRSSWQRYNGGFSRGYFSRRYRPPAVRTLATESVVVFGDALISRDLAALRGRLAGWRAGRGLPRRSRPPAVAVDRSIGFWRSLQLRRGVYG